MRALNTFVFTLEELRGLAVVRALSICPAASVIPD